MSTRGTRFVEVLSPGLLSTVQDAGRPGHASLGVPESGALDAPAFRLANRLVGNPEDAALIEVTFGDLRLHASTSLVVAVTGAPVPVSVDDGVRAAGSAVAVPEGAVLELGTPTAGVRNYVAVRGGLQVPQLLGSASTDLLSVLGRPLEPGDTLPVGPIPATPIPAVDIAPQASPPDGSVELRIVLGPRDDWFTDEAIQDLLSTVWVVDDASNRVGMRLQGPALTRRRDDELASEGTVAGSLQVPGGGRPVLFLADHPVTGGYPVIACVVTDDLPLAAQARPGQGVRLRPIPSPLRSTRDLEETR